MATRLKPSADPNTNLCRAIEAAARDDDGTAAREHLAAAFPINYCDMDTPDDPVVKKYQEGRRELVQFDAKGEHFPCAVA